MRNSLPQQTTDPIKRYLAQIGRAGGKAASGAAKVRGDSDYYKAISKKAAASRKRKRDDGRAKNK